MRKILNKLNRPLLVAVATIFSIIFSFLLLVGSYTVLGIEIRQSELVMAIIAPLLIAPAVTWYLFGLLKDLDSLEKEMRILATYDPLTKLLSRRSFFEKATYYYNLAIREKQPFAVLMIDIDHFKRINDQFGHPGGDYVLESIGKLIQQHQRQSDLVGRYGGEEFIFFLWDISETGIKTYTGRLHQRIYDMQLNYDKHIVQLSISIGAAYHSANTSALSLAEVVQQADDALYLAKKSGRNQTVMYSDEVK